MSQASQKARRRPARVPGRAKREPRVRRRAEGAQRRVRVCTSQFLVVSSFLSICVDGRERTNERRCACLGAYPTPSFREEGQLESRGRECDLKARRKLGPLFSPHPKKMLKSRTQLFIQALRSREPVAKSLAGKMPEERSAHINPSLSISRTIISRMWLVEMVGAKARRISNHVHRSCVGAAAPEIIGLEIIVNKLYETWQQRNFWGILLDPGIPPLEFEDLTESSDMKR